MLQQAYEAFLIEVGLYGDVFTRDFDNWGVLATDGTWFKNFWEFASYLKIEVTLDPQHHLGPVREGDRAIIEVFLHDGFEGILLSWLNRVRKFKCVVHLSDLVLADGRTLRADVFDRTPGTSRQYRFPLEYPSTSDFALWEHALRTACIPGGNILSPGLRLPARLGGYVAEPHQHVEWFQSGDAETIFFCPRDNIDDSYDEFRMRTDGGATRTCYGHHFNWAGTRRGVPPKDVQASVTLHEDDTVQFHSALPVYRTPPLKTDFWEILHSFPNQSLWRDFRCNGDGSWVHRGLMMGSLVIVHDGSYMPHVAKDVCSAGFMIYCKNYKYKAKGTVVERSSDADNYRAEILGGVMIQLILRAASQRRSSPYHPAPVECDNMGVVTHGNSTRRALPEKQAQADVLRCLKSLVLE